MQAAELIYLTELELELVWPLCVDEIGPTRQSAMKTETVPFFVLRRRARVISQCFRGSAGLATSSTLCSLAL